MRHAEIFHHSAGAVIIEEDRCLVLRSDKGWVLPKGHLDEREVATEAAVREVREETGLQVAIEGPVGATRYRFGRGLRERKHVEWFLARVVGGELHPEPWVREARFVQREEAVRLLTHAADREIVELAFESLAGRARAEGTGP